MTTLGLGSYALAWAIGVPGYAPPEHPLGVFGLVSRAAALGLHLVQIADNLPLHALTDTERHRLRDEASGSGVAIEVGTRGIRSEHLRQYLELARFFGSPILRVVVDFGAHHPEPDEVIDLLRPELPRFAEAGITLAIENHDRFSVLTLANIITTLNHPNVGICLDTVNSFGSLEGPHVVITTLAPFVVNLHLKEFIIRRVDHNMGFVITGAPVGQGMLDVPRLLEVLRQHRRSFNAIVETWPAPEPTMAATITKEASWVEQSVMYLRQFIQD